MLTIFGVGILIIVTSEEFHVVNQKPRRITYFSEGNTKEFHTQGSPLKNSKGVGGGRDIKYGLLIKTSICQGNYNIYNVRN